MRIAQIAPMYEPVPPKYYGGTERVVACLCDGLVARGHTVTLFASGESHTRAALRATTPRALRRQMTRDEMLTVAPLLHLAMLSRVLQQADEFDIIHSHVDHYTFPFSRFVATPVVTTMHGRLDLPYLPPVLSCYPEAALVSISLSQRQPLAELPINWVGCVPNGLAVDEIPFNARGGDYLVWIGRICPEKRPDWAVEVARRANMPLKVAAKIDPVDEDYWRTEIEPLFKANRVIFVGEVDDAEKAALIGGAYATLFSIDWPEPFGLVMVESLACGTPVIAMNRGSVPEVLRDGVSGIICDALDEMVAAVPRVARLDRRTCRREAERFSAAIMATGYEQVYQQLLTSYSSYDPALLPAAPRAAMVGRHL